ncbi:ACPP (predicted) [Pycnogonum litorale]
MCSVDNNTSKRKVSCITPKMKSILFVLCIVLWKTCDSKVIQLTVIHRHGARTPVVFYPNDPHKHDYWSRGLGQLTNEGKVQEYELGNFIRLKYDELLGKQYFANKTSYRSTDVDRTLMSAQLVSASLFKPQGDDVWNKELEWQPIPVHTVGLMNDFLMSRDSCPEYGRLFKEALEVPPLSTVAARYAPLFKKLSEHVGMKVNLLNFWEIYDDVSKEIARNMSEPDWIMDVWSQIVRLDNEQFGLLVPSKQMKRLKGGPLLKEFVDHAKAKITNSMSEVAFLYSGHDTTVATILDTLGVYNGLQPPYASAIFMELHQINDHSQAHSDFGVQILYRNDSKHDAMPLLIPGCDRVMCPFDTFVSVVKDVLPDDIKKECKIDSNKIRVTFDKDLRLIAVVISGFIVLEVISGIIICVVMKRRYNNGFRVLSVVD